MNLFLTVPVAALFGGFATALLLGASWKRTHVIASILAHLSGGLAAATIGYYGTYFLRAMAIDLFEHLGAPAEFGGIAGMFAVGWISLYVFVTIGSLATPRGDSAGQSQPT